MKFVLFLTDSYGMTPEDYLQPTSQRDYFCSTFGVFFLFTVLIQTHYMEKNTKDIHLKFLFQ